MDSEEKARARRSSILKAQRPKSPLQAIALEPTENKYKEKRRVSFASSNFIKPFAADPEKNTIWDNTYEEEVNHTDSVKNSGSNADVYISSLNISVLDNSSPDSFELDKENLSPEPEGLEQASVSEIKIYNDFEHVPTVVECIKNNKTVIFDDNVMELTSLRTENPITNKELKRMNSNEVSLNIQNNYTLLNKSATMEFTMVSGVQEILNTDLAKKEVGVSSDMSNVGECIDMEITNAFPSPQRTAIQSNVKLNRTMDESLTMEFTNMLPDIQASVKTVLPKREQNTSKQLSILERSVDMEFTNVLPSGQIILQQQDAPKVNDQSTLNKSITMNFTSVLPETEDIFKNLDQVMEEKCTNISQSIHKVLPKQSVKTAELYEDLLESKVDISPLRQIKSKLGMDAAYVSKCDQTIDMELTNIFAKTVPSVQSKIGNNDTISNESVTMEFKNIFPVLQEVSKIVPAKREISYCENVLKSNQTMDMEFTNIFPNVPYPNTLTPSDSEVRHKDTIWNESVTMEFTNVFPVLQEISKSVPAKEICGSDFKLNQTVDMEFIKSAQNQVANKNTILNELVTMEFTNVIPVSQEISKSVPAEGETSDCDNALKLKTTVDMEVSNISPNTINETESDINIMANVNTRDRRSRKTMNLNREDNSFENIMAENTSETFPALNRNEHLGTSLKNNVLYSEPGYLNAQDMTAPPITPSTSFSIDSTPPVSQQRVLATVQPSDILQDMFKHKSLDSVLDCNEQDIVTNGHDVIDQIMKEQPDQSNIYNLDDTSVVLVEGSNDMLDSTCDYTQHCRMILKNIEKYLVPGDNLIPTSREKEREERFQKICKDLEEVKSKVAEFEKNFSLPGPDWMDFEETFRQHKADSSGDNMTDESVLVETKVPKIKDTKPLLDLVQEAAERNTSYWQFIKCKNDRYYFTTLFETLPFIIQVHPELGIVYRVDTFKNLKDNLEPIFYCNHDYLELKLKQDNLLPVLGSKYDILTLLDYICMTLTEIMEFHHKLKQLEDKYGSSHKLRMTSDFRIIIEILSEELIIWWVISIKLSKTSMGLVEDIAAVSKLGEKVNEDHIKQISEKIAKGCIQSYIESLVQKIDEYVQRVGRGIRYRRQYEQDEECESVK